MTVQASAVGSGAYRATFPLPATIVPGTYEAELLPAGGGGGGGGGSVPLRMFLTPDSPRHSTITIHPAAPKTTRLVNVADYCKLGVDCGVAGTNSSFALAAVRSRA
eukprot:COSAG06_NODE_15190_length_1091_cov_1.410282_3_plen_105_part_01